MRLLAFEVGDEQAPICFAIGIVRLYFYRSLRSGRSSLPNQVRYFMGNLSNVNNPDAFGSFPTIHSTGRPGAKILIRQRLTYPA